MPMAVPGIARISVVSASMVLRPGACVLVMIQAIGTPMTRHSTSARPAYTKELMMNFGVSMLTAWKNSMV